MEGFEQVQYQLNSGERHWKLSIPRNLDAKQTQSTEGDDPWTELSFHQCDHCPLSKQVRCPVAENLNSYVREFTTLASFDEVTATVTIDDRIIVTTQTSAQQVISSLVGIVIALSSECPSTKVLLPMVAYHRPFSTQEESIYRSIANAAVLFQLQSTQITFADFVLQHYKNLHHINVGLVKRLQAGHPDWEALVNAIVNLDLFVKEIIYNAKAEFPDIEQLKKLI